MGCAMLARTNPILYLRPDEPAHGTCSHCATGTVASTCSGCGRTKAVAVGWCRKYEEFVDPREVLDGDDAECWEIG